MMARSTTQPPFYENISRKMSDIAYTITEKWRGWFKEVDRAMNGDGAAPSAVSGASPIIWTNTLPYNVMLLISGGTGVGISYSRDSTTYYPVGVSSGQVMIFPGDTVKITYTSSPTINAVYR